MYVPCFTTTIDSLECLHEIGLYQYSFHDQIHVHHLRDCK